MSEKVVGQFRLKLLGLPKNGDCLLISILHQMQLAENVPPDLDLINSQVPRLRASVCGLLRDRYRPGDQEIARKFVAPSCVGDYEVIGMLSQWLEVNIEVFKDDGNRRTYPASLPGRPVLRIYRSCQNSHISFDSVCAFTVLSSVQPLGHSLHIGTWNLSGATSPEKRMVIDKIISDLGLDILCLQETHMYSQRLETAHYAWLLGPQTSRRASRGCGFAIRKGFRQPYEFVSHSVNICQLTVTLPSRLKLYLLCVHKTSEGAARSSLETGLLTSLIRDLIPVGEVLLCGDMNAHLGKDLIASGDQSVLGSFLYHDISNANGRDIYEMCNQLALRLETTMHHYSTRCTWYRSTGSSQIDHVIAPSNASYIISYMFGRWTKYSDHKLLTFHLRFPPQGKNNR